MLARWAPEGWGGMAALSGSVAPILDVSRYEMEPILGSGLILALEMGVRIRAPDFHHPTLTASSFLHR